MTTFNLQSELRALENHIPILNTEFYSNPLLHWLTALLIVIVTANILNGIRHVVWERLYQFAKRTETDIDDYVVSLFGHLNIILFASFGLTLAAPILTLPWSVIEMVDLFPVLAFLIQIGIWGHITIHFLLNRYVRSRDNEEELLAVKSMLPPFRIVAFIFLWTTLFLIALANLKINITAFLTGLGVGGVALALAVQNILGDLFAAFSIVIDKPFVLGDFIIVDDFLGTVENIGLKTTRLRSLSGEQLIFSNSDLLKSRIRNYKRMYERRVVFQFNIPFNTPVENLKEIPGQIRAIIEAQQKTRFDRAHFAKYGDSFFTFEVVYYVLSPDYNQYMDIQQQINLAILENLREKDIELAYPTRTLHMTQETPPAAV